MKYFIAVKINQKLPWNIDFSANSLVPVTSQHGDQAVGVSWLVLDCEIVETGIRVSSPGA